MTLTQSVIAMIEFGCSVKIKFEQPTLDSRNLSILFVAITYLDCLPVVEESFQGAPAELGRLEVVLGHVGVGQVGRRLRGAFPGGTLPRPKSGGTWIKLETDVLFNLIWDDRTQCHLHNSTDRLREM